MGIEGESDEDVRGEEWDRKEFRMTKYGKKKRK